MAAETTKTNDNNQQTNSQCWGSPFHQHCERKHYEQTHHQHQQRQKKMLMYIPSRSQPLETELTQTHFSSCIGSLHWVCWMNLEPQTWLFFQLSSSNQNFTSGVLPATQRVRPPDLSFAQMFFHQSSAPS